MYLLRESPLNRPWQCDIYKDIQLILDIILEYDEEGNLKKASTEQVIYNYAIILNQECDLEQDYINRKTNHEDQYYRRVRPVEIKHDKYIPMILMAPVYLADLLKEGDHLAESNQKMETIVRKNLDKIIINEDKRYHYLKKKIDLNMPDLVIDFKHCFAISRDVFYNKYLNNSYIASMTILYRENLSHRFYSFASRIGIPDDIRETKLLTDSLCSSIPPKNDLSFQLIPYWI